MTIRQMGQVGATLAFLVLWDGALVLQTTGSYEATAIEMLYMAQMCQVVALRAGARAAKLVARTADPR